MKKLFNRNLTAILLVTIFFFQAGCIVNKNHFKEKLKEGDLLFQNLNCGPLCDAIEAVTSGIGNKNFSHCAMIISVNDTLKVIEAIGDMVQINSLYHFFKRSNDTNKVVNITVGRLNKNYTALIPDAVRNAKKFVGEPYDNEFLLNNGKLYCSELIYEAFKEANGNADFFLPEPMTFKQPGKDVFFPVWIDYYKDLGLDIPEGKPGLNPGSISRSEKITIIIKYKLPWKNR